MTQVYKDNNLRVIRSKDLDKYIAAGWTESLQSAPKGKKILVEEPTILQPTIEAKTIVNPIIGDANDKENEDGSIDR
jgi:hypothetical protein